SQLRDVRSRTRRCRAGVAPIRRRRGGRAGAPASLVSVANSSPRPRRRATFFYMDQVRESLNRYAIETRGATRGATQGPPGPPRLRPAVESPALRVYARVRLTVALTAVGATLVMAYLGHRAPVPRANVPRVSSWSSHCTSAPLGFEPS